MSSNDPQRRVYSASELDRRAGLNPTERRTLVQAGILNPARTGGGWAVFSDDDMAAARQWKQQRSARR